MRLFLVVAFLSLIFSLASCDREHIKLELGHDLVVEEDPEFDEVSLSYRPTPGSFIQIKGLNRKCIYQTTKYILLPHTITINDQDSTVYYLFPIAKANPQEVEEALIGPLDRDSVEAYVSFSQFTDENKRCY